MQSILGDYLPLVVFIAISAVISGVLLVMPFVVAYQSPDPEKLSAYECGFNAFDDARMKFDIRFYLVSLLFIIFDLRSRVPVSVGRLVSSCRCPRDSGR